MRPSRIAQFLLVVACWLAVALAAFLQGRRDDLRARIDLASEDQRPEAPAIIGHVMPLLLVEAGPKKVHGHLQFMNHVLFSWVSCLAPDDAEGFEVFLI